MTQVAREKNPSTLNRSGTYDFLDTNPDAIPMIYRGLVSSKVIKLGSCDKHTAYCEDWNADYTGVITKKIALKVVRQ